MNKKEKKIFRKFAALFSRLTPEQDQAIQERIDREISSVGDLTEAEYDEIKVRKIQLAVKYAKEMLRPKVIIPRRKLILN